MSEKREFPLSQNELATWLKWHWSQHYALLVSLPQGKERES